MLLCSEKLVILQIQISYVSWIYFLCKNLSDILERLPKERSKELAKILANAMNQKLEKMGLKLAFQYDECHDDVEYLILVSEIENFERRGAPPTSSIPC